MKGIMNSAWLAACLLLGGTLMFAGQADKSLMKDWRKEKTGRAENAQPRTETAQAANLGRDRWFREKYGRATPLTEAREQEELQSTAFRAEPSSKHSEYTWSELRFREKYGRSDPAR